MGKAVNEITIYQRDGSVRYKLNSYTQLCAIKSAEQKRELLGEDNVTLKTTSAVPMECSIGDYIIVYGSVYTLNKAGECTKNGERSYEQSYVFEGLQYKLLDAQYRNADAAGHNPTANFSIVANMELLMQVLLTNVNRVASTLDEVWVLGDCPSTEYREFTYNNQNCLNVLQSACEEFETEFEIVQTSEKHYTLHIRKQGALLPATFDFSKQSGVYKLRRKNVNSADIVTRLYVEGGTQNIGNGYRNGSERLRLAGESYVQSAVGIAAFGIKEGSKQYDEVYPHRTGRVTAIVAGNGLQFVDSEMFNLNEKEGGNTKYLIDGTSAKVKFTGNSNLAGYTFEINKYDHSTHTFTLIQYEDKRGLKLPDGGAYKIAVGDEYVLLDIVMPQDPYVTDAESELQHDGEEDVEALSQPRVEYELEIASLSLEKEYGTEEGIVNVFQVGDLLHIKDTDINVDKAIRIKSFTRDCYADPYKYKVTLSDTLDVTLVERLIEDNIRQNEVIALHDLTNIAKARANWRSTQELLNMVFDGDGYFDTENIKPNSIETMMLSVGNRAGQMVLRNVVIEANAIVSGVPQPNVLKVTSNSGVLIHYAIEEQDRTWSVQGLAVTLSNNNAYYIYAKCQKSTNTAGIIVSQEKLAVDDGNSNGYYYFLIGVLSSVYNGYRDITLTYGATRITGRTINCGKIESVDGETYFDLDKGEIGGNIKFRSTSGGTRNVNELEGDIAGLGTDVDLLQTATSGLQSDVDAHTQAIGNLQTTTGNQATQIVNLQTLTGSKVRMYITASESATPTAPYQAGDLWLMSDTYKIKICTITNSGNTYRASDWQWAGYTDDTAANNALAGLSSLANDSVITPAEKLQLQTDKNNLVADYVVVLAQVRAAGVQTTNFESAYNTLIAYIDSLLEDMSTATEVVRGTYNSNFSNYYTQRANVLKAHTGVIERGISDNGTTIEELERLIDGQSDTLEFLQDMVDSLQEQVDGTVEYWYGSVAPTLNNAPASSWTNAETRNSHLGDLYTDTETGLEYRFTKQGNTYVWQNVPSTGIGTAIQTANQAMDLAGNKSHVFVTQNAETTPPATYKKGDLWVMIDTMRMRYCLQDGDGVTYNAAHWADAGYTDDTAANNALSQLSNLADDSIITPAEKLELQTKWAELSADYSVLITQATSAGVSTTVFTYYYNQLKTMVEGLLEDMSTESSITRTTYDSRFSNYYKYRATLQKNMTESKSKVYTTGSYSTKPAATYRKGDLWVTLNDYKVRICTTTCTGTYSDSHWKEAGYTDDTTANVAITQLNQLADDSVITPAEKLTLATLFQDIVADFASLSLQATSLGVNTTELERAYSALHPYIAGILETMSVNTTIVRSEYDNYFAAYYTARGNITASINIAKARTYITANYNTKPSTTTYKAGDFWLTLNDCKIRICKTSCNGTWEDADWVAAGYTDDTAANAAQALLDAMGSDSKITPAEKLQLQTEFSNITADHTSIKAKAQSAGVSVADFDAAYNALATYVATLLANMGTTSDIDRTTYDSKFYAYYTARGSLLAEISKKQAQDAVDGLEIGQGNYINNGAFFSNFSGWESTADTKQLYVDSTMGSCMRFGKSSTSSYFFLTTAWVSKGGNLALPNNKFNSGTKYTLAFWVRANKNIQLRVGFMNPAGDVYVQNYTEFVVGTSWKRISMTFTANGNSREDTRLYIRGEQTTTFEYLLFTKFVLVEGNKAPEWTDSSSEFKAQLEANKATLQAITGNYTQIDGGLILSTFLKLGALLKSGVYQESAGVKAMLESIDEVAAYFGGTLAEAIAGTKEGMTIIYHNGKLKALNAEITGKVVAETGSIGGLRISGGSIGAEGDGSTGSSSSVFISREFLCLTGSGYWAGIGDVMPSYNPNKSLMRIENNMQNQYNTNLGIIINVSGGQRNCAISANASIKSSTWIKDYGFTAITPPLNTCYVIGEKIAPNPFKILALYNNANSGIGLPKKSTVAFHLGIPNSEPFAVKCSILGRIGSTQSGYIVGRNTDIAGMDTDDYPYIRNNNGGWERHKIGQAAGDVDEFMLVYDGMSYQAHWLTHRN